MPNFIKSPYSDDPNTYCWDWCQDSYRDHNSNFVEITTVMNFDETKLLITNSHLVPPQDFNLGTEEEFLESMIYYTADGSKRVLGLAVVNKNGMSVLNHPEWKDVDWEYYSWDE